MGNTQQPQNSNGYPQKMANSSRQSMSPNNARKREDWKTMHLEIREDILIVQYVQSIQKVFFSKRSSVESMRTTELNSFTEIREPMSHPFDELKNELSHEKIPVRKNEEINSAFDTNINYLG